MVYSYWKGNRINDNAVFELYFRKNPFKGEYTLFGGLDEVLQFLKDFKFIESDIAYVKSVLPGADPEFFKYLENLNTSELTVESLKPGTVCFPRVPLLTVSGPLPVVQLIETTLLNLTNFASLVATNAARMRIASDLKLTQTQVETFKQTGTKPRAKLLEFGLRRAQGPDGGMTASKYCILGGFDATSNMLAGQRYGINIAGTHAHSYINSFTDDAPSDPKTVMIDGHNIYEIAVQERSGILKILEKSTEPKDMELHAFSVYAATFPDSTICLIDTYDTLGSGLINFLAVATALKKIGKQVKGIRIDSGDLAYISNECRKAFVKLENTGDDKFDGFSKIMISASNNIDEQTLYALHEHGHEIDAFGIGTSLVTCKAQPALGCVYKLVELSGIPRMKITEEAEKVTMPGRKESYRFYNSEGTPLCDVMLKKGEDAPNAGNVFQLRHPFQAGKRAKAMPARVEKLHQVVFQNGKVCGVVEDLQVCRKRALEQLGTLRPDVKRRLNPTRYKVSVSNDFYNFMHKMWEDYAPVGYLN